MVAPRLIAKLSVVDLSWRDGRNRNALSPCANRFGVHASTAQELPRRLGQKCAHAPVALLPQQRANHVVVASRFISSIDLPPPNA